MRREESTATVPQSAKQLCVCTDDARFTEVTPDPQLESTARCIDRACITDKDEAITLNETKQWYHSSPEPYLLSCRRCPRS